MEKPEAVEGVKQRVGGAGGRFWMKGDVGRYGVLGEGREEGGVVDERKRAFL